MIELIYTLLRSIRSAISKIALWFKPSVRDLFKNINPEDIEIRRAGEGDLPDLEKFLTSGDFMKHRKRLARQAEGKGDYLIAEGKIPVGHIYIAWEGPRDGPLDKREEKEPLIEDFRIHPAAQGRGIGRVLLREAEDLVRKRGYQRVGVSVIATNPSLERMYHRAGYRNSGLGIFTSRRIFTDRKGKSREWKRKVKHLIKYLPEN